jgi:hypothetical protein
MSISLSSSLSLQFAKNHPDGATIDKYIGDAIWCSSISATSYGVLRPRRSRSRSRSRGFAEPIRGGKVLGLRDDAGQKAQIIREEQDAFKFMLDLQKHDEQVAIHTLDDPRG